MLDYKDRIILAKIRSASQIQPVCSKDEQKHGRDDECIRMDDLRRMVREEDTYESIKLLLFDLVDGVREKKRNSI